MAGTTLIALKRRLKTVKSTRKITMAMGLVATSKYQRARILLTGNTAHYESFSEIVNEILNSIPPTEETPGLFLQSPNPQARRLYLMLNSDKGLVGGYNSSLAHEAIAIIAQESKEPLILTTGYRGTAPINEHLEEGSLKEFPLGDLPGPREAALLLRDPLELYRTGQVSEVRIIYNHYLSALRDEIRVETLLPFARPRRESDEIAARFDFDPDPAMMQDQILGMYLKEKMYHMLLHAKTVEHSTRMKAMDSANKNADDILRDLSRQLNRLRQSVITQEITEIIGGAEALK